MTSPLPFIESDDPRYGDVRQESQLVRRVMARNPGPFTYMGTGTFIVGRGSVAIIDPGPALFSHVNAVHMAVVGEKVSHILVTHTHLDHSGAAKILAERTGAPVFAYGVHGWGRAAGLGDEDVEAGADRIFKPNKKLRDGELLRGPGWTIEAIHTPGHTSNHICFRLREEDTLFSGDHIMGWSTTVISPPDGDMALYLKSLEKVRERDFSIVRPTHGPVIEHPNVFIEKLINHRLEREEEIVTAVRNGLSNIQEIVELVYFDVPKSLHASAARSTLAHLIWLVDKGVVSADPKPRLEATYSLS
ncbi:MAG: MBL fold metallo-hydrolase [Sphingomonadales bacterium]